MGRKRKKRGTRPSKRGAKPARATDPRRALAEAIRRGRQGQPLRAVKHAEEALRSADSAERRRVAGRVLAEAHLHAALASEDVADVLAHTEQALRADEGSSRAAFYRGLALLQLGRVEAGRTALEKSLEGGVDLPTGGTHVRQFARLVADRSWSASALSDVERVELELIQGLLRAVEGREVDTTALQLGLFSRAATGKTDALEDTRVWHALLSMATDPASAPVTELREATKSAPPLARARIRYYEAVARVRGGEEDDDDGLFQSLADEGLDTPALRHNLVASLRASAQDLALAGRWQELARVPLDAGSAAAEDRILAEIVALAHDHLAHEAAASGDWREAARHWRRAEGLNPSRGLAQNLALAEEALGEWTAAAQAWRAMARRRPRKPEHPDYLTDEQVAALWSHASDCYERAIDEDEDEEVDPDEVLTCVQTALKYAPDDLELRMRRAHLLWVQDSNDLAANELDAILERDPANLEALKLRAQVEEEDDAGDPAPFLRRALELAPRDADLRDSLASTYIGRAVGPPGILGRLVRPLDTRQRIRTLEQGLSDVPDHPALLTALGVAYATAGDRTRALATLRRALEESTGNRAAAGEALHELVHAAGDDEGPVLEAMTRVRERGGLSPTFWIGQAEAILDCDLHPRWFDRFLDEALTLADDPDTRDSRAAVLFLAWEVAEDTDHDAVARRIEERIRTDVPESGAVQLVQARRLAVTRDGSRARRLLNEAARRARRAGDPSLQEIVERVRLLMGSPLELLRILGGLIR